MLAIGFILFIVLIVVLRRILVNVGAKEIAVKERRYIGRKMPPGRVGATEGEVDIQADGLKPGCTSSSTRSSASCIKCL